MAHLEYSTSFWKYNFITQTQWESYDETPESNIQLEQDIPGAVELVIHVKYQINRRWAGWVPKACKVILWTMFSSTIASFGDPSHLSSYDYLFSQLQNSPLNLFSWSEILQNSPLNLFSWSEIENSTMNNCPKLLKTTESVISDPTNASGTPKNLWVTHGSYPPT